MIRRIVRTLAVVAVVMMLAPLAEAAPKHVVRHRVRHTSRVSSSVKTTRTKHKAHRRTVVRRTTVRRNRTKPQ